MKTNFTSEQDFIKEIALPAQKACKRYGYLPSVLIGQACLQNGYGIKSYWDNPQIEALLTYNNMVGIKSSLLNNSWTDIGLSVWNGESLTKKTPEQYRGKTVIITDNFRKYDSIQQSFVDFLLFLTYASNDGPGGKPKYGQAVLSIKDPETLIKKVNSLGYATSSSYAKNVMKIVNKHNLTIYDDLSNIPQTKYIPKALTKEDSKNMEKNVIKVEQKKIIDVTAQNKGQVPRRRTESIKWIVCHYLGVKNADNENLYGGGYGGHFYISRTGKIYKAAQPATAVVWQCGGGIQGESKDGSGVSPHRYYKQCTNYNSIGIECGVYYDSDWYFSKESQISYVWLVSYLMDKYNIDINHVIRHFDVTGKTCPYPWVKNNHHNTSWTWNEFINNLKQYRSSGTIKLPDGSSIDVAPAPSSDSNTRSYLRQGDKGTEVKKMQQMLITCGYSCGSSGADGDFGKATLQAVKQFQKQNDLKVDGYYGSKSKEKLTTLFNKQHSSSASTTSSSSIEDATSYDKNLAKIYTTTAKLNMRRGAGLNKEIITVIPYDTNVTCYGYYTDDWYCVQYNGQVGYCNKQWLK